MLFKRLVGAIFLAAMALPAVAQQVPTATETFPTAAEILHPTPKKDANTPRYAIAFGKVMARIDKTGVTRFNYQKGRLVSEVLPNSVVGTYQYDRTGKFQGISYNDGRTIKLAFNPNGSIAGLNTNSKARVKFKGKYRPAPETQQLGGFLEIQNGVSTIQMSMGKCIGTDDDDSCTILVQDTLPDLDMDYGSGGGGFYTEPYAGGGTIYPRTGSAYETPAECQQYVCESGREGFDKICALVAKPGADRANCFSKSMEYYSKCLRSCESGDWTWLNDFSFIWG